MRPRAPRKIGREGGGLPLNYGMARKVAGGVCAGCAGLPSLSRREWRSRSRKTQSAAPVSAHASLSSCILAAKARGAPRRAPPQVAGTV